MFRRGSSQKQRIVVNTIATGVGNLWAMVVSLVSLPLLLGGMGRTAFGTWVLLQTLSAVNGWLSLADLGVGVAVRRAVATKQAHGEDDGLRQVLGSSLAIYAVVGLGSAVLVATVGRWGLPSLFGTPQSLVDELHTALVLFALQVVVDLALAWALACLEGLQRVDIGRALDAARRTAVAVATVIAALTLHSLSAVAAASVAATSLTAVVTVVVLRRHLPGGPGRPHFAEMAGLLRYGTSAGLLSATGVLQRTMDRVIVGSLISPAAVALVEIATQLQNAAAAVLSASSYAVTTSASWLRAREDRAGLAKLLLRGTKYSLLITYFVLALIAVLAAAIVELWVGPSFSDAAGLTVVALIALAIAAPMQVGVNLLLGTGRAASAALPAVVAVAVNLVVSVVLVQHVGIVGVFLGTVTGASLLLIPLGRVVFQETGTKAGEFLRLAVLPSLLPALALVVAGSLAVRSPLNAAGTLAVGSVAGMAAFFVVASTYSVRREEARELIEQVVART